jgi:hypothetical protein
MRALDTETRKMQAHIPTHLLPFSESQSGQRKVADNTEDKFYYLVPNSTKPTFHLHLKLCISHFEKEVSG